LTQVNYFIHETKVDSHGHARGTYGYTQSFTM